MAQYIRFDDSQGTVSNDGVLIEVDEAEVAFPGGPVKAGVVDRVEETVVQAQATFQGALERVVRQNSQALIQSVRNLAESPNEVEITFGLKATGEVGNFAIAKGGAEANLTVRLLWQREAEKQ
jgi:hypothetical protein